LYKGEIKMATTRTGGGSSSIGVLNMLSYIAVIALGIILALAYFFDGDGGYLGAIAYALACIVIACYSWRWARVRGIIYIIPWVIAVVLIVIFVILPIIK
jgi:hypothetical protein